MEICRSFGGFLLRHHLPIGLTCAIFIGAFLPQIGGAVSSLPFSASNIAVGLIFFIQGLKLETQEARDAFSSIRAVIYGIVFILLVSPLIAIPLVKYCRLDPIELTLGIALFLTMPTTISTGAVLTREAHGNTSLTVLLSVGSTLLSLFVLPFTIEKLALSQASVELDPVTFLINLSLTVFGPLVIGKLIRDYVPRALDAINASNSLMKYLSSVALILVPWLQISKSSQAIRSLSFTAILLTGLLGLLVHFVLLAINWLVCRLGSNWMKLDFGKQKSIILACSGKTVAIGIAVLPMLDYDEDKKGLLAVPLVLAHLIQTIIDSMIADHWKSLYSMQDAIGQANGGTEGVEGPSIEMPETVVPVEDSNLRSSLIDENQRRSDDAGTQA